MKFGRTYTVYVQEEAQLLLPECPNVEFKRFKKLLKRCPHHTAPVDAFGASVSTATSTTQNGATITECDENMEDSNNLSERRTSAEPVENDNSCAKSCCPVCDAEFFPDLDKAVSAVVGCFNSRAKELLRLHMASGFRKYLLRLRSKIASDEGTMIQVGNTLVSYGCMNALAIRKILKKYDKVHSSEIGRAFKTRLHVKRVELLQSPLLIELGALAVNLMDSQVPRALAQPEPQALVQGHYSACNFNDDKQTITCALPDGVRLDFDLTCSICLEVVFDPVALGCGHIFCNSCSCAAASVPVFHGASSAKRSSKCPLCRQTGVYSDTVPMGELHRLVRNRCSSYYAKRLPEERDLRIRDAKLFWEKETPRLLGL